MPDSPPPLVVILTGLPCSGKTTIGLRIAERLSLPYYHKDGFKILAQIVERLGPGRLAPIALDAPYLEIDTTDFAAVNLEAVIDRVLAYGH